VERTVVIKVGGSLLGWPGFPGRLEGFLGAVASRRVALVVGGGAAADLVRQLDATHSLGEARSHALALRALDLTAHLAASLVPGLQVVERPAELGAVWRDGRTPVLAPRWFLENVDRYAEDPLPETWECTTDSIAARVARAIGASELVLLKSTSPGRVTSRTEAARLGLVDPRFPEASAWLDEVSVVNLRESPPGLAVWR
jgi:aspartokinase-like uncharacterized kinase